LNIGSVFKSILSLLDENPITNEPGWEAYAITHPKAKAYADWVEYRLAKHTVAENRKYSNGLNPLWDKFGDVFGEIWPAHLEKIRTRIALRALEPQQEFVSIPYGMFGTTQWGDISV